MNNEKTVRPRDPGVRLFHQALVATLTLSYLSGVIVSSILHRENLVGAMITGNKVKRK
ncbi:MAG: hypothetical protein R6X15_06435 [Pseudomonadota bacterium]